MVFILVPSGIYMVTSASVALPLVSRVVYLSSMEHIQMEVHLHLQVNSWKFELILHPLQCLCKYYYYSLRSPLQTPVWYSCLYFTFHLQLYSFYHQIFLNSLPFSSFLLFFLCCCSRLHIFLPCLMISLIHASLHPTNLQSDYRCLSKVT